MDRSVETSPLGAPRDRLDARPEVRLATDPLEQFVEAWTRLVGTFAARGVAPVEPLIQLGRSLSELRVTVVRGGFERDGVALQAGGLLARLCEEDGIAGLRVVAIGSDAVIGLVEAFAVRLVIGLDGEDDLVTLLRGVPGVGVERVSRPPPARPRPGIEPGEAPDIVGLVPVRPEVIGAEEVAQVARDPGESPASLSVRVVDWALLDGRYETSHAQLAERLATGAAAAMAALGDWRTMLRLLRNLHRAQGGARPARFLEPTLLLRLLERAGDESAEIPRDLLEVLRLVPGDPFEHLIGVLQHGEESPSARRVAMVLLERVAAARLPDLLDALDAARGASAVDLLAIVVRIEGADRVTVVTRAARHPDREVVLGGLALLEGLPIEARSSGVLFALLSHAEVEIRLRAMELLGRRQEEAAWSPIFSRLDAEAQQMEPYEQARAGATLAQLDPARTLEVVEGWLKPAGLGWLWGGPPRRPEVVPAAIGALASLPGEEPERLLSRLESRLPEGELRSAAAAARRARGAG